MSSCNVTKSLKEDELLYMGTKIQVQDKQEAKSVETFNTSLNAIPEKGTKTGLGNIYTGLYNLYDETGDKGFKHWVKYKMGEEPVLFDVEVIDRTEARLSYYLNGKGFFGHTINCDSTKNDKKVNVVCNVNLGQRYAIDSLIFPIDSTYAALKLDEKLKRAIIKEGEFYDRDRLDFERTRLATLASEIGFADFGSENIFYYVDTSLIKKKVNIYTQIIKPTDSTFHTRYTLDSIIIYPNYSIGDTTAKEFKQKDLTKGISVIETNHYLDHSLINRLILEEPGKYYSGTAEKKTINRLLDLGLFRFINITNDPTENGRFGGITQKIYLTPELIQGISGELELNNRSGNFLGTGASAKYHHKNIFGHAERLDISLGGQIETQFGDGVSFINSSDLNGNVEITFPRLIIPFIKIQESRNFIPRTVLRTNYTYQRRTQFYTLQSLTGKFGYRWRQNEKVQHELFPIALNRVIVRNKSDKFQTILDNDIRLASSFEDVFIEGIQYNMTYSSQANSADKTHVYIRTELETSGNLLSIFNSGTAANPATIAGTQYAQFTKLTMDARKYFSIGNIDIATRIIVGAGFAYGNSSELPYIKQYLIGGSNSIRAFRLRGLGPGAFVTDSSILDPFAAQFVDQTGDMKLELNAEMRFPIFGFFKGALFVDAGNVWLIDNDVQPEGNFNISDFYNEIGIGTGLGLRIDFNFFLIRMDIAFPLRSPIQNQGFVWIPDGINPLDSQWRNENLRYNLGIGYPF